MTQNRIGKKKRKGRPKTTWIDGIRKIIGGMGLKEENWKDIQNWRWKITEPI